MSEEELQQIWDNLAPAVLDFFYLFGADGLSALTGVEFKIDASGFDGLMDKIIAMDDEGKETPG